MTRKRFGVLAGVAMIAATGLGAGVALAVAGTGSTAAPAAAHARPGYSWYRSMMGRHYGGPMMGGAGPGWVRGPGGYRWMAGGATPPGWMRGGQLPGPMMGSGSDPGEVMGRLWADAPGPRVPAAQAIRLAGEVPPGVRVDQAARTVTVTTASVHLTAVAGPPGGPDETFRIAGMVNPAITVPAGTRVSIQLINADPGTAHGLVITSGGQPSSPMPMMTARPAFGGSAVWFLGGPTAAGMHTAAVSFVADTPGDYRYLCPVPGHSQRGMSGAFIVRTR